VTFFRAFIVLLSMQALPALAAEQSPFAPPPAEKPKRVRILAFADYLDTQTFAEFERATGYQIAYDSYEAPDAIPERLRDGPYDLLILPGPELAREIAAGAVQKFDKAKAPNSSKIAPAPAAKIAAYDKSGAYALVYGWFATGLLYDADAMRTRLGAPPVSWAAIFSLEQARKLSDCGLATPDARDELFVAAWRYLGVDPAKAAAPEIKRAGDLLAHAKMGIRMFGAPDLPGALANGSSCLGIGSQSDAQLATSRAAASGQKLDIRFALPKEGGPMSLDAIAIPKDAPNLAQAYALADFLLRPDIAARNAKAANVISSEATGNDEMLKRLWPSGALALAPLADKEWARLRAAK
jgi:putrescine transport system substrate-binding protein